MIEQLEVEQPRAFLHAAGHRQVFAGRIGVSGRVVVGHEETLRVGSDDRGEDL